MRVLSLEEIGFVSGGHGEQSGGGEAGNQQNISPADMSSPPIELYERVVYATSRLIEKAANVLKGL